MRLTKSLVAAAVAAMMATQAVAGGFAPVVVAPAPLEPVVVVEPEAPRSTFGLLLPLLLLGGLVALAVASDDDDEDDDDDTDTDVTDTEDEDGGEADF